MQKLTITALALGALVLAGCSESAPNSGAGTTGGTTEPSTAWLLDASPAATAIPVGMVKPDAREGDAVVIVGRIGGRVEPMSADSPTFLIIDASVEDCTAEGDEGCPTPWDYCCTPAERLTANAATVVLVDDEGLTLDANPVDAGLKPSDTVVIVGTVGPRPSPDVLTIRATGVHRVDG